MIGHGALAATATTSGYTVGMMNWLTQPIMNTSDQATLITFAGENTAPSIQNGWIIQEVADTIEGGANYPRVNAYITAVDQAGHRISLNYGTTGWQGDASIVAAQVTSILNYLDASTATLTTNIGPSGPTIDINLDVEPTGGTTSTQWASMISQINALIQTHNSGSPAVYASLSAFISAGLQGELIAQNEIAGVWANIDTLVVMAYRNLPCFSVPCVGTTTAPCADGFMRSVLALVDTVPSGKHCSIALELGLDGDAIGGYCYKISFGAIGIYNHKHSTDPLTYRRNYLTTAMNQGWAMLSPSQQQKLHPDGAFILHSYQWLSCFRDDVAPTGGSVCSPAGACADQTKCAPTLAGQAPDVNHDGVVDATDLEVIYSHLGTCPTDSTLDGTVAMGDLLELLNTWGPCN